MEIKYYDERYYLSRFGTTERKILEYWKEKPAACSIQYIYQNGAVLPEEKMVPDFNKEFFVFTTLNIHKATVVINYNP